MSKPFNKYQQRSTINVSETENSSSEPEAPITKEEASTSPEQYNVPGIPESNNEVKMSQEKIDATTSDSTDPAKVGTSPAKVNAPLQSSTQTSSQTTTQTANQEVSFKSVAKVEMGLVTYLENMDKSKSIVPEEGGKRQYGLWILIQDIINSKDQKQFNDEWNTLLNFFNKYKDNVFNENFIYRFPQNWTGSNTEFTNFRRLVHLAITSCDPSTRNKNMEVINLEKALELLSEVQKNNVINFYA